MTLWRGRMQFLQHRRKIFDLRYKKIAQSTKMIKNYSFFEKRVHWSVFMCTKKAVFTSSPIIFRRKAKKLSLMVPKWRRKYYIFLKRIFFDKKIFVWARRKQFSQPRRQSFDKTPKNSTQSLKKTIIPFFKKIYLS